MHTILHNIGFLCIYTAPTPPENSSKYLMYFDVYTAVSSTYY